MEIITKERLLEAGAHFGHQTKRWNPKMKKYIFMKKNDVYIINLDKTLVKIEEAIHFLHSIVHKGGKVLFVGTKRQVKEIVKEKAIAADSFYVTERWLGGTLTNLQTIKKSIQKLWNIERKAKAGELLLLPKKEQILIQKQKEKLDKFLTGIRYMRTLPQAVFITDTNVEHNAIKEAKKLNIPIIAICDTNSDPDGIDYIIPANDDAVKTINLIVGLVANAIITATNDHQSSSVTSDNAPDPIIQDANVPSPTTATTPEQPSPVAEEKTTINSEQSEEDN